jgi:hypothetical protein
MRKKIGIIVLASIVGLGCIKKKDLDFKNLQIDNWQPDWALPILNSDLTLKNMIQGDTYITEDAEGVYSLHYSGDLFQAVASDFVRIPDQAYTVAPQTLTVPQTSVSFTGTINDSFSNHFTFTDTSGAQLAHVNVKTGWITFDVNSTFNQNLTVNLILPSVLKGGSPLQITTNVFYPSTTSSVKIDLSGYNFDLTNSGATKNYLPYKVRFTVAGTGQPLAVSNSISASIGVTDITYSFIDGYLGHYDIPIPSDTINVAVFDNTLTADIFLNNPKINLAFKNSLGVNVSAKFDNLYGVTATRGATPNYLINPINITGATVVGQTAVSTYTIDSANTAGAVQNLFNPAPNHVIYNGRVMVNPGGTSSTYNFITDSSMVAVSAEAELPAWFKIVTFQLQDTTKLTLPEDSSVLQSAEFKLLMDNALPLYGRVQLYFCDQNFNFLDSLVPTAQDIIGEAPVDGQGKVNGRKQNVTTFSMTHAQYNAMAPKVKHAIIRGSLKSSGSNSIKIQSSNDLIVKLAFRFKLNVSSTDL